MAKSIRNLTDKKAIISALDEFDQLGREKFLKKYKFGKAKRYFILRGGNHYDSKAIFGSAYGYQFDKPLTPYDFSGGKYTIIPILENLGFKVVSIAIDDQSSALPEEVPDDYPEGARRQISVNAYERNSDARKACIEHHGTQCVVCRFDFGLTYGKEFSGFIHVHHTVPLSRINRVYNVNPKKDMRPVCPNCHAVIHYGRKNRSIDQLRNILRSRIND